MCDGAKGHFPTIQDVPYTKKDCDVLETFLKMFPTGKGCELKAIMFLQEYAPNLNIFPNKIYALYEQKFAYLRKKRCIT